MRSIIDFYKPELPMDYGYSPVSSAIIRHLWGKRSITKSGTEVYHRNGYMIVKARWGRGGWVVMTYTSDDHNQAIDVCRFYTDRAVINKKLANQYLLEQMHRRGGGEDPLPF